MSHQDVRKGMTNANFNEENSNILFGEIAIIAIGIGLITQSWWWGGGIFIGFIIALFIKPIAIFLMIVLSIGWGVVGYAIGAAFDSTGAMIVLSILGFLAGAGLHFSALEWAEDIS
jgi:hypothetical protein